MLSLAGNVFDTVSHLSTLSRVGIGLALAVISAGFSALNSLLDRKTGDDNGFIGVAGWIIGIIGVVILIELL